MIEPDLHLAPGRPDEPDWAKRFPMPDDVELGDAAVVSRLREVAKEAWGEWVPALDAVGQLSGNVDRKAVEEACVLMALVDRCDRVVSMTKIGPEVFNRAVTAANNYRTHLFKAMAMIGVAPGARSWMKPRETSADDNPTWDA